MAKLSAQKWIFGHGRSDFLWLFFPGLACLLIVHIMTESSLASADRLVIFSILCMSILDGGHSYTTVWRTYFRKSERVKDIRYWLVPGCFFAAAVVWTKMGWPFFWNCFAYFTLFHYIRQYVGIFRWYEKLNARFDRLAEKFFYILLVAPLVVAHFRPGMVTGHFSKSDFLLFPNAPLFVAGVIFCSLVLVAWAVYEMSLYRQGLRELNRVVAIGFPSMLNMLCLFKGDGWAEIVLPIVVTHGAGYLAIMTHSLHRIEPKRWTLKAAAIVIIATALIAGQWDWWFDQLVVETNYTTESLTWLQAIALAIMATPTMTHYVIDGWIWKRSHQDSALIYAAGTYGATDAQGPNFTR